MATKLMASKRNSRVYIDECVQSISQTIPASYRSRRNSRNSTKDDRSEKDMDIEKAKPVSMLSEDMAVLEGQHYTATTYHTKGTSPPPTRVHTRHHQANTLPSVKAFPIRQTVHDFPTAPLEGRPLNFGVVVPGVFRSSYPKPHDYDYIKALNLKTVITLVKKDELDEELQSFTAQNGINQRRFYMQGTKKASIPLDTMAAILDVMMDKQNHPILLHCNQGKHRTGCVIAVARIISGWSRDTALDEYRTYAEPKVREGDLDYIASFQTSSLVMEAPGSARLSTVQVKTFLRTLLFSSFVMVIWFVSGSQMNTSRAVEGY